MGDKESEIGSGPRAEEKETAQAPAPRAGVKETATVPGPPSGAKETTAKPSDTGKKKLDFSTWIALAGAAVAIIAAFISGSQVNVAEAQNVAADQQQLVGITIAIEQALSGEQSAEEQAGANLTGTAKSAAEASVDITVATETAADAEAGAVIISDLHGNGVAGIEYVTVARALANYGNTALAITYFKDAVNVSLDNVAVRADALRYEGGLYYSFGEDALGHQDFMTAAQIYTGHLELTRSYIDNSIAQAYLLDAGEQILAGGCRTAATDMADASRALTPLGADGANLINQTLTSADDAAYSKKCSA